MEHAGICDALRQLILYVFFMLPSCVFPHVTNIHFYCGTQRFESVATKE